ncbi:hypothetical protein [Rubellimicrobium aerolatum]|uniref:Uncharacterized protein n=1 Tax=Rubellimicrobium aerolatum TaxID=490979 RepID=A0ABW0SH67_9RHOB|nr:hypothetical protein [Rubellimicrobium aerolatum]MBP1807701.1 hypothetical protein [Rubellimicrobium aerolatum]
MIRILPFIAAALVATAGAASASNTFGLGQVQSSQTLIRLGTVVAQDVGTVAIYDYRTGQEGGLLGATTVRAGANTDVKVSIRPTSTRNVLAVLTVDGQPVARQILRIED